MYKVLLVDSDSISSMEMLQGMLEWNQIGFELDGYASKPAEAIALLNRNWFSIILIGMNTAHSDALFLCDYIRQKSRVPIILIGGSNDFQLARKALYYQVSDYLPNPVSPEELTSSLQAVKQDLDCDTDKNKALLWTPTDKDACPPVNIIEKVKEYVDDALNQNITLKQISISLHFNCSYLGQKFKYYENMTFNEYLLQQRMEKAKLLLENTDLKIYEIANEIGYTEIDWFYKKFKSYTGVSANEYRKMFSIIA
ncbi:YesN/AraC family two-component response regulator [Paenibacillus castaneae]|uniref:helix-turn-helix domain-containing protein n=1 Tax=Paenibacillus castaneae TaxID=474957 RepID=UPI000C9AAC41|nr:helix-turn-helix domain-containing protein [Paenibacillus castaneae]NIK77023.1 YesN/AraC family two-component response regulator [Paenibacillus castaneae]